MLTTCLINQLIAVKNGILHVQTVLIMQQLPTPRPKMNRGIRIPIQCNTTTFQPSIATRVAMARTTQVSILVLL